MDAHPEIPDDLRVLGEHYRLTSHLGEGAFGDVYIAHHDLLDQEFAVKVLKPELCEAEASRARFLDEARALIRFSHPNVVQLRHVGEHGNRLYLVMDLVRGEPLNELMKREGPFDEQRALGMLAQILLGLEAAHAHGIVHRDLKPSNLLVERNDKGQEIVRILDFGLSKLTDGGGLAGAHRSITGTIVGTLAYMSPEQIKGDRDIDQRSDVFASGLLLHEMLEGAHPYPDESGIVVAANILREPIPDLSEAVAKRIRPETRDALRQALRRDRSERTESVIAFRNDLGLVATPTSPSVIAARSVVTAPPAAAAPAQTTKSPEPERKRAWLPALLALAVLGGGAWWFFKGRKTDAPKRGDEVARGTQDGGGAAADGGVVKPPERLDPESPEPGASAGASAGTNSSTDDASASDDGADGAEAATDGIEEGLPDVGDLSPADCCVTARSEFDEGRWAKARALYHHVLGEEMEPGDVGRAVHVGALRGVAESYVAEATALGQRGKAEEAVRVLKDALGFLEARLKIYRATSKQADEIRLQMGFTRMHLGEVHTLIARWLAVLGKQDEGRNHLKPAADSFKFAHSNLDRDGQRYDEFLLRRAQLHRLRNDWPAYAKDLHEATRLQSERVLRRAWVMHAMGQRFMALAWQAQRKKANAHASAKKGVSIAKKGVGWCEDHFTRDEWCELLHTLCVAGATLNPRDLEDALSLEGLARFWFKKAQTADTVPWHDPRVLAANMKTAEATVAYLGGLAKRHANKRKESAALLATAERLAGEGIRARVAIGQDGGPLPQQPAYLVLAAIRAARGDSAGALDARKQAAIVNQKNPE